MEIGNFIAQARRMVWRLLFLISFLGVSEKACGARNRKRELHSRDAVIYAFPVQRCPQPCSCPAIGEECGNCGECPRQIGEPCGEDRTCDVQKGLICSYKHGDPEGVCKESSGVPCVVHNRTYEHGITFNLDCRTQCTCQNGTYGCSSLCPQEHISPRGSCQHPRLVELPNQCCREWMCDSQTGKHTLLEPGHCQSRLAPRHEVFAVRGHFGDLQNISFQRLVHPTNSKALEHIA